MEKIKKHYLLKLFMGAFLLTQMKTWIEAQIYLVNLDGTGNFTSIKACANVAKAGDTCLVKSGEFDDFVTTKYGGTEGNYVTFQADGHVVMNGFDIKHPYVKVDGFDIVQWNIQKIISQSPYTVRSVYIESAAKNCIFSNNVIRDSAFVSLNNVYFNSANKTITFLDDLNGKYVKGGFVKAGFKPGDPLTIKAFENQPLLNVSLASVFINRSPTAISERTLELSAASKVIQEGPVHAYITAFNSGVNFNGVALEASSCTIKGNTFTYLNGFPLIVSGVGNIIEYNKFSLIAGGDVFQAWGHDHIFRYNLITNSTPKIVPRMHQDFIQTFAEQGMRPSYNMTFDHNLIENFDGAIAQLNCVDNPTGVSEIIPSFHDFHFTNNVFYNVTGQASVDLPNTYFINNTFFSAGVTAKAALVFSSYLFPNKLDGGIADGSIVKNNAFVSIGESKQSGWYGQDANTKMGETDYNFVAGSPASGYQSKTTFKELHGINGGDPLFSNIDNIVGPDGLPFTADDGFIPLTGSPLCYGSDTGKHIGAYPCRGCVDNSPIANFNAMPNQGFSPLAVSFDGSKSQSCASNLSYSWNFGDGNTSTGATVNHIFTAGTYTVSLMIKNNLSQSATISHDVHVFPAQEPGLLIHLDFDNELIDSSGRGNITKWVGPAKFVDGKINQGADLTTSYLEVAHSPYLDGMAHFSFSFWAKKNSPNASGTFFEKLVAYRVISNSNGFSVNLNGSPNSFTVATGTNDTKWHHYAMSYNGSTISMYLDGKLMKTGSLSGPITNEYPRSLLIGAQVGTPNFNGVIDEFRLYDRVLSPQEIIYFSTNTVDTIPPVRSAEQPKGIIPYGSTSLLLSLKTNKVSTCKWSLTPNQSYEAMSATFSTTKATFHSTSVSGLKEGQNYSYYIRCQDLLGNFNIDDDLISFQVASPPPTEGMVMHLNFDQDYSQGIVEDMSGLKNNGRCDTKLNQCPEVQLGPDKSSAARFFGLYPDAANTGNYLSVAKSPSLTNMTQGTFSLWVKYEPQTDTIATLLDAFQKTGENPPGTDIGIQGTWSLNRDFYSNNRFMAFDKNGVKQTLISFPDGSVFSNAIIGKANWTHYAVTWDGSQVKGYLNGLIIASASQENFPYFTVGHYLSIGANAHSSPENSGTEHFPNHGFANALLDDIRIYSRALTSAEVAGLYVVNKSTITLPTPENSFSLVVTKSGTGLGTVNSMPFGISCGETCTASFSSGTIITLTSQANPGSVFSGWSDPYCFTSDICTFPLNESLIISANFSQLGGADGGTHPTGTEIFKNIFNPTKGEWLDIPLKIPSPAHVSIIVVDRHGNKLKTLFDGDKQQDETVTWAGTNESGSIVAAGTYSLILKVGDKTEFKKIVVIK